jgi:predicted transcriptional regulator
MNTAAILSIKPIYANQILAGEKTIELRKSSMGLSKGDIILVYSSSPEQRFHFWFQIQKIEKLPVNKMWQKHYKHLGIDYESYESYFKDTHEAVGLHIGKIQPFLPIPLREAEKLIPGFVPPQGIIWLRDEFGRFKKFLSEISCPLPKNVFPQRSLNFDFSHVGNQ